VPGDVVRFFARPDLWRRWLERYHVSATELWVGFRKRASKKASITWPEAVDEALCFGWIDGLRKSVDAEAYKIRFTPRKASSTWSAVNVARVAELTKLGKMTEAGLVAFAKRKADKTGIYSHERPKAAELEPSMQSRFEKNKLAWTYFQARPPWYRRAAFHWVMSAKRDETRERRFEKLLEDSSEGRPIGPLTRPGATT
jgi:uncharacterized protein YdeI (YjbR/CyaY-like superfamily)